MIVKINVKTHRVRAHKDNTTCTKRIKAEWEATEAALNGVRKPTTPAAITLRRVAPGSKGLGGADLWEALNTIMVVVSRWVGQDADIKWKYAQRPGKKDEWFVEVEWT